MVDRVKLLRDNQCDQYISNTEQSEESTTDSTGYFEKINTISEPAFKIGQHVFSFEHISAQAMAFSHCEALPRVASTRNKSLF